MEYPDFISLHEEPETYSWIQVWFKALTEPNEEMYKRLIKDPKAGLGRALAWISLSLLLQLPIKVIEEYYVDIIEFISRIGNFPEQASTLFEDFFFFLLNLLFCKPAGLMFQLVLFMLGTAILHFVARFIFRGEGKYAEQAYAIAAFAAPFSFILTVISIIPYVSYLTLLLYIYLSFLIVLALKTTQRFSWGKAVASYLIPIAILIIIACISLLLIAVLAEGLFDFFGV